MPSPHHSLFDARRWVVASAAALVVAGCAKKQDKPARAPVPVVVATASRRAVPFTISANGLVTPIQLATVAPQVDGLITRVAFQEGQDVTKGQPLFDIERSPYEAAYAQSLAALARDRAAAVNARKEVQRYDELETKDYVTKEQADQIRATADAADATVKADEALVATAKFNLDKTTIRAPIGGRTGALLVRTGNVVHAAQATPLVTINQIRPILVRFAVPGTDLPLIQKYASARGGLPVTAVPGATPTSHGADTSTYNDPPGARADSDVTPSQRLITVPPAQGQLFFIDNTVDTTTGTVMLKATFPNPGGTLWAGEYVSTTLQLFVEQNALTVPTPAVQNGQQGTYVYVVDSTGAARQRPVAVARTADTLSVIASGLRDGERVVTDGQSRLTPGAKVTVLTGRGVTTETASDPPGQKRRHKS